MSTLAELKSRGYRPGDENSLDLVDPDLIARAKPIVSLLRRYFRYEVEGIERVPRHGGAIVISPHSTVSVDGFLLGSTIYEQLGRLVRGLTDHALFRIPGLRSGVLRLGIVDGTRDNAVRLLKRGELCFAMPGGAYEAWKPSRDRYRLLWDGHTGFVRVALAAGVPIVPSVCIGSEEALYLPVHSVALGQKLLGLRVPLVPPIGLGPLPFPVKFRAYVGNPIHFGLPEDAADDDDAVAECHAQVVGVIKEMIETGLRERRSLWR